MTTLHLRMPLAAVFLAVAALAAAGVLPLNFDGGSGTSDVDQWRGTGGSGWNAGWATNISSGGSITGSIATAAPLFPGGGNYLSMSIDNGRGTASRNYDSEGTAPALDVNQPHIIQLLHRLDYIGPDFATGGRRVVIFDNTAAGETTSSTNTWAIAVDATSSWLAYDGNRAGSSTRMDTGFAHSLGTVYLISVLTIPSTRTWSVMMTDGVNMGWALNYGYRANANPGTQLLFGHDSNTTPGGMGDPGDDTKFSLDAIHLSTQAKAWAAGGASSWFTPANWSSSTSAPGAPSVFHSVSISNGGTAVVGPAFLGATGNQPLSAFAGAVTIASGAADSGTLKLDGGMLTAQSIRRGLGTAAFHWDAGTLRVGTFGASGAPFNLLNTGTGILSPVSFSSASPIGTTTVWGDYVQGPAATLALDIGGYAMGQFDRLIVNGDVYLQGFVAPTLVGGFEPVSGSVFDLIAASGSIADGGLALVGTYWSASFLRVHESGGTTYLQLNFVAIPEPGTLALLGLGLLGVARWRRTAKP